jgi:hypothetical protein
VSLCLPIYWTIVLGRLEAGLLDYFCDSNVRQPPIALRFSTAIYLKRSQIFNRKRLFFETAGVLVKLYFTRGIIAPRIMFSNRVEDSNNVMASLMQELGTAQGYTCYKPKQSQDQDHRIDGTDKKDKRANDSKSRSGWSALQLLPELEGYPDSRRLVGNSEIWNPYVPCLNDRRRKIIFPLLATNPQIEVIRRRAFERFKQACYNLLQEQSPGNRQSDKNNEMMCLSPSSIPAFFEKWHMDCKLQEHLQLLRRQQQHPQEDMQWKSTVLDSTAEIHSRFQFFQQQESPAWMDPILVSTRFVSETFSQAYRQEIIRACYTKTENKNHNSTTLDEEPERLLRSSKFQRHLKKLKKAIYKFTCDCLQYFSKELTTATSREVSSSSQRAKKPKIRIPPNGETLTERHGLVTVTHVGLTFQVNLSHYVKLQRLFDRATSCTINAKHRNGTGDVGSKVCFEDALFCLLCRYDTLQGAGLQAAVPGSVMNLLLQRFDCRCECFASPLNSRYEAFNSVFGNEIDSLFGSVGNFFSQDFSTGGCFQANPPFCEQVICQLCITIRDVLAAHPTEPLMFVVIVPVWKNSRGYQQLLTLLHDQHGADEKDGRNNNHLILQQGCHFYAEGTQYRRASTFRVASFDTSIFFFQNCKAKQKWPLTTEIFGELESAFCVDPRNSSASPAAKKQRSTEAPKRQVGSDKNVQACKARLDTVERQQIDSQKTAPEIQNTACAPTRTGEASTVSAPKKKRAKLVQSSCQPNDAKEEGKAQLQLLHALGLGEEERHCCSPDKRPTKRPKTMKQRNQQKTKTQTPTPLDLDSCWQSSSSKRKRGENKPDRRS